MYVGDSFESRFSGTRVCKATNRYDFVSSNQPLKNGVGPRPCHIEKSWRGEVHLIFGDLSIKRGSNARKKSRWRKNVCWRKCCGENLSGFGWSYFNCYSADLSESRHLEQTVPRALRNALRKCFEHTRLRQTEQMLPANSSSLAAQIKHLMGAIEILIIVSLEDATRLIQQLMPRSYRKHPFFFYFPP